MFAEHLTKWKSLGASISSCNVNNEPLKCIFLIDASSEHFYYLVNAMVALFEHSRLPCESKVFSSNWLSVDPDLIFSLG